MKITATTIALMSLACAAKDATVTTTASAIDTSTPWQRHEIDSSLTGADGVHLRDANGDGLKDIAVPWEGSGTTTVSIHPGYGSVTSPWVTFAVGTSLGPVEDAHLRDLDGDGAVDVISASENRRVYVHWAPALPADYTDPSKWTTMVIDASINIEKWMQIDTGDMDGDGDIDIVVGGRNATPAGIYIFHQPAAPRTGADWTTERIGDCGFIMSLEVGDYDADSDLDVFVTDRTFIGGTDPRDWSLHGARWLEQAGTGWTNHTIGTVSNQGDPKMGTPVDVDGDADLDVVDCASSATQDNLFKRTNTGGMTMWTSATLPHPAAGVGQCQDIIALDIDSSPATIEFVVSASDADGEHGVYWLDAAGVLGEISGDAIGAGAKFDNVEREDMDGDGDPDIVTTEQTDGLGIVWYENPDLGTLIPDAGPPGPDACVCP